jgi:archaeal type IV pilus assembly protein PilA
MTITKNDEAMSPVIGTILMVMIAVMLGAIIGIYAFGISSNVQNIRIIATSVVQSGSDILITYQGGQAHPDLASMAIIAPNATTFITVSSGGALSTTGTPVCPDVGSVMVLSGAGTSDQDHVMVIGNFNDGSSQVISDTFV